MMRGRRNLGMARSESKEASVKFRSEVKDCFGNL